MKDPAGRPRGFGFVQFKEPHSVDTVLSSQEPHIVDNKAVSLICTLYMYATTVDHTKRVEKCVFDILLHISETTRNISMFYV